jgi:hypothetical protein
MSTNIMKRTSLLALTGALCLLTALPTAEAQYRRPSTTTRRRRGGWRSIYILAIVLVSCYTLFLLSDHVASCSSSFRFYSLSSFSWPFSSYGSASSEPSSAEDARLRTTLSYPFITTKPHTLRPTITRTSMRTGRTSMQTARTLLGTIVTPTTMANKT